MQIANDQAVFMEITVRAMNAKRAIEVGTFTGYSSIAVARGMGPDGRLICCDVSEDWTAIATEFWAKAGLADRVELRLGPAIDTLRALSHDEQFDFAFIDADKVGYGAYYDELLPRVRRGGLILVDNTLWNGTVLDRSDEDEEVVALREFNDRVAGDERVQLVMLPISDGITILQKK
jgi:caffeoyl-CoA O-methyltransferase